MKITTVNGPIEVPEPPIGEVRNYDGGNSFVLAWPLQYRKPLCLEYYYYGGAALQAHIAPLDEYWILVPAPKSREEQRRKRLASMLKDFEHANWETKFGMFLDMIEALYRELPVDIDARS